MVKKLCLIYSEKFLGHIPPVEHPEKPSRIVTAYESLVAKGLKEYVEVKPPKLASEEILTLAHSSEYVNSIKELSKSGGGFLDADTYVSPDTFEVSLYAIGGVVVGVEEILRNPERHVFALIRPPGHHAGVNGRALKAPSLGFCIFNNVAVAAKYLHEKGIDRVAIVDVDCHHGNGTQEIFADDDRVLFISLHQDPETIYPGTGRLEDVGHGRGEGYTINLPLPPGSGDDVYLMLFKRVIKPILEEYTPKTILISAGYDGYKGDPLGDLYLSSNCYWKLFNELSSLAFKVSSGRLLAVLEGGYGQGLSRGFPSSIAGLLNRELNIEPPTVSRASVRDKVKNLVKDAKRLLRSWWHSLQ